MRSYEWKEGRGIGNGKGRVRRGTKPTTKGRGHETEGACRFGDRVTPGTSTSVPSLLRTPTFKSEGTQLVVEKGKCSTKGQGSRDEN